MSHTYSGPASITKSYFICKVIFFRKKYFTTINHGGYHQIAKIEVEEQSWSQCMILYIVDPNRPTHWKWRLFLGWTHGIVTLADPYWDFALLMGFQIVSHPLRQWNKFHMLDLAMIHLSSFVGSVNAELHCAKCCLSDPSWHSNVHLWSWSTFVQVMASGCIKPLPQPKFTNCQQNPVIRRISKNICCQNALNIHHLFDSENFSHLWLVYSWPSLQFSKPHFLWPAVTTDTQQT